MQLRRLTTLKVIFLSTSFFLTLFTFYSANVYIRVYETIRNFDTSTPELKVTVSNASYASTETTMTLLNPSRSKLELVQVIEGIHLNGDFIAIGNLDMPDKSAEIHPMSEITITIKANIPSYRIRYVTSKIEGTWIINVRIVLSTEIVGTFSWRGSWLITDV